MNILNLNIDMIANFFFAGLCGLLLKICLSYSNQKWVDTYHYTLTFILLPVITLTITRIISNNIALALGMVGAFSLFFQDIFTSGFIDLRSTFFWMALFFLLLIPALTMRSFAEEKRTGTIEMLATLPISEEQLVIGKFMAALVVVGLALVLSLTYPISLSQLGDLDWGVVIGGYLGLFSMADGLILASSSLQSSEAK